MVKGELTVYMRIWLAITSYWGIVASTLNIKHKNTVAKLKNKQIKSYDLVGNLSSWTELWCYVVRRKLGLADKKMEMKVKGSKIYTNMMSWYEPANFPLGLSRKLYMFIWMRRYCLLRLVAGMTGMGLPVIMDTRFCWWDLMPRAPKPRPPMPLLVLLECDRSMFITVFVSVAALGALMERLGDPLILCMDSMSGMWLLGFLTSNLYRMVTRTRTTKKTETEWEGEAYFTQQACEYKSVWSIFQPFICWCWSRRIVGEVRVVKCQAFHLSLWRNFSLLLFSSISFFSYLFIFYGGRKWRKKICSQQNGK